MSTTTRRILPSAIALLLLVLAHSTSSGQNRSKPAPFVSDEGGFSIVIPNGFGEPESSQQQIPTAMGTFPLNMYLAQTPSGKEAAMIAYIDYPAEVIEAGDPNTMLDSGQVGALRNMGNAKVLKQRDASIDGNPGRSVTFSTTSGGMKLYGRMDFYLVNNRLYQIFYASNKSKDVDRKDVKTLFTSFTLTGE